MKTRVDVFFTLSVFVFLIWPYFGICQSSSNYALRKDVQDQGGMASTSANYRLVDAIGQPFPVGNSSSTEHNEISGFLVGVDILSGIENAEFSKIPMNFQLLQNYPNPFNPETVIEYDLPEDGDVQFWIYDLRGQLIWEKIEKGKPAGSHALQWDGKDMHGEMVGSGVYLYRIEVTTKQKRYGGTKKMLFVK